MGKLLVKIVRKPSHDAFLCMENMILHEMKEKYPKLLNFTLTIYIF